MTPRTRLALIIAATFVAAIVGVFIGDRLLPHLRGTGPDLHELVHHKLDLNSGQRARLEELERHFALQRKAIELELRSDNAVLAQAIELEHGYGPRVSSAVDLSHQAMGRLQKETLAHVFQMRQILRPSQAATFDRAVTKALTDEGK